MGLTTTDSRSENALTHGVVASVYSQHTHTQHIVDGGRAKSNLPGVQDVIGLSWRWCVTCGRQEGLFPVTHQLGEIAFAFCVCRVGQMCVNVYRNGPLPEMY